LVIGFGALEDIASRRSLRLWPAPRPTHRFVWVSALAGVALMIVSLTSISIKRDTAGEIFAARQLTVPSQAPPKPRFDAPSVHVEGAVSPKVRTDLTTPIRPVDTALAPLPAAPLAQHLDETFDAWIRQWGIEGAEVGVTRPQDFLWRRASGIDIDGRAATVDTRFDIGSITKTFTTALVLQLVEEGSITLDEPLPVLRDVPDFRYSGRMTVRDLLYHRSGLVNYRDTHAFQRDPFSVVTPAQAVMVSADEPLQFEPGTGTAYASTNFLLLGMLVEQRTGKSFDENLRTRLFEPLALDNVSHLGPLPGMPNHATAGVVTSTADLLRWGAALYRDGRVVSDRALDLMTAIDPVTGLGGGTFGYCPCTLTAEGEPLFTYIGHSGGMTILRYAVDDDLVMSINLSVSVWTPDMVQATADFFEMVRAVVRANTAPPTVDDRAAPTTPPPTE
jgi:CubicO group peptidase (beta-lactamase class C family)